MIGGELVRKSTPFEGEVLKRRRFKDLRGSDNGCLVGKLLLIGSYGHVHMHELLGGMMIYKAL